ncbi:MULTISPECIES: class Ib ribonucleoside-diphosphate reductase assembly flavoprotein NrdI [unclassified Granulicatella]|uniref:class Ib ribonucleoside-diphosphate reductase assembly flavoprotein NrdI n=1 Tax=unclassified Granulicatella TaxID=2630493 RepID=UPI0010734593|nr:MULTISPECIES: class Ib ribonucleoside-diphosphate reductase assembly flavoprotein NrdI [unclassified Granulicatella]MBF0779863.1 class Ib ribonucleoside-diphosphate reductase assembly flavoprotein NrdI [Granulicatella sp. 19428wC4_WM01]TFU96067.1 class Ib ribonucleoside-diphosphate reductase assembly flavoprotein NrdI [Granulicatella sp. WM01]
MKIVYMSMTGQTRKFVKKLGMDSLEITLDNAFQEIYEPYVIVAPTYEKEATSILNDFIETGHNQSYLKGVAGGGNRNFNTLFCFTAKDLAQDYHVPLLHLFEFQGSDYDVKFFKEKVNELG